jgi:UDP-N-acetylmuramate dehydrogenase
VVFEIQEQVDLTPYNSFGVSQMAAYFADIQNPSDLRQAREFAALNRLSVLVLGQGSNTLFINDYPGLVLYMNNRGRQMLPGAGMLRAAAGESWHEIVRYCLKNSLYGIENLALIPGTVGAAPVQNIGAYGVELDQFFVELEAFDLKTGEIRHMSKTDCQFAYRDSIFKQDQGQKLVILSVTLQLALEPALEIGYAGLADVLTGQQVTPQSFFKNPLVSKAKLLSLRESYPELPAWNTEDADLVKVPAAWLLDQKGWKGRRRGGAAVHEDHALVLVNRDNASGEDVVLLAQEMSSSVLQSFGIVLQTEVQII